LLRASVKPYEFSFNPNGFTFSSYELLFNHYGFLFSFHELPFNRRVFENDVLVFVSHSSN
ncbi:hypothetical protein J1N35_026415, partial [Gossypium stocksii]